jgi:hypothetical protein
MKKLLPTLLLISSTIISASIDELSISDNLSELSNSTHSFRNNTESHKEAIELSFCHDVKPQQNIHQIEILRLINMKKEARKIYNFEYKQSQKRKRLQIIIPENAKQEHSNTDLINNPKIRWIYNDDDHISPIGKQYPTIIQKNHHKIKNINDAKFDIEIHKLLALIPELSHS